MVKVIALEWTKPKPPFDGVSHYDHCETPIGCYEIEWKGWKSAPGFSLSLNGEYVGTGSSLDDAKQMAAAHFGGIVARCLVDDKGNG